MRADEAAIARVMRYSLAEDERCRVERERERAKELMRERKRRADAGEETWVCVWRLGWLLKLFAALGIYVCVDGFWIPICCVWTAGPCAEE